MIFRVDHICNSGASFVTVRRTGTFIDGDALDECFKGRTRENRSDLMFLFHLKMFQY
jgi:hypothetical protein